MADRQFYNPEVGLELKDDNTVTIFKTEPKPLPIVCRILGSSPLSPIDYDIDSFGTDEESNFDLYTCSSPRLLDILFSSPGTRILSSPVAFIELQYLPNPKLTPEQHGSRSKHSCERILFSASYETEHESKMYFKFVGVMRFISFASTFAFFFTLFPERKTSDQ